MLLLDSYGVHRGIFSVIRSELSMARGCEPTSYCGEGVQLASKGGFRAAYRNGVCNAGVWSTAVSRHYTQLRNLRSHAVGVH